MTSVAEADAGIGEWVLVEREMGLLLIGETVFNGVSSRKILGEDSRALLLPAVRNALDGRRGNSTTIERRGETSWSITTEVVYSPATKFPIAVLGLINDPTKRVPSKPVVGAWEWEVHPPGSANPMRSFWDENLFALYELPPSSAERSTGVWDAPTWFNNVVAPRDRLRLKAMIDQGIEAVTPELHTLVYDVITGFGSPQPGKATLRLAGRAYEDSSAGTQRIWLRGISHRITYEARESTPGLSDVRVDDFLRAIAELTDDAAICVIDTEYSLVYFTSPGWVRLGFALPRTGALGDICHPDDLNALNEYLTTSGTRPNKTSLLVKIRTNSGGWAISIAQASAVTSGNARDRYIVMRASLATD